MQVKAKKAMSIILVFAFVFCLFASLPLTASAESATELAERINSHNHGGTGTLSATVSTSVSGAPGNTVTVTGTVADAKNALQLDLDADVTVIWKADYSGAIDGDYSWNSTMTYNETSMISISAKGSCLFEVAEGGSVVNNGSGVAIFVDQAGLLNVTDVITIKVTGGTVSSEGTSAIFAPFNYVGSFRNEVYVEDGVVYAANGEAINAYGGKIAVSGGAVSSGGYDFTIYGRSITVSGGVVASSYGSAIGASEEGSAVTVSGGFVFSTVYSAGSDETDTVGAIFMEHGEPDVSLNAGVICVWKRIMETFNVFTEGSSNELTVIPAGASAVWGKSNDQTGIIYENNGQSSLGTVGAFAGGSFFPIDGVIIADEGACVVTFITASGNAIPTQTVNTGDKAVRPADPVRPDYTFLGWYAVPDSSPSKGFWDFQGYYDFNDPVTEHLYMYAVDEKTGNLPELVGPMDITLQAGYGSMSTDAYVITNAEGPRIIQDTDHGGKITWNDETKKIDIAAGLEAGVYQVVLTLQSFGLNDIPFLFTLRVTASETSAGDMSNFTKAYNYSGQFTDVADTWSYDYITFAYEYGLMQGAEAMFNPNGNMTVAEAITIAARIHNIYYGGDGVFEQGSVWYQVYADYAVDNGILTAENLSGLVYGQAATRAEMALIFTSSLPPVEFASQNSVNSLPDVNASTSYSEAIIMMYKAGIFAGRDATGSFAPESNVTRAEVAAIVCRIILPEMRFSGNTYG